MDFITLTCQNSSIWTNKNTAYQPQWRKLTRTSNKQWVVHIGKNASDKVGFRFDPLLSPIQAPTGPRRKELGNESMFPFSPISL